MTQGSRVTRNALRVLSWEDGVWRVDADHWRVRPLRGNAWVPVHRRGGFGCGVDKRATQEAPCCHILAVLVYEGIEPHPCRASAIHAEQSVFERRAWQRVPERFPELLGALLEAAALPDSVGVGRPRAPLRATVFESVLKCLHRNDPRVPYAWTEAANPYAPRGRSTLSRFQSDPESRAVLAGLLDRAVRPAKPFEAPVTVSHALPLVAVPRRGVTAPPVLVASWTPRLGFIAAVHVHDSAPGAVLEDVGGVGRRWAQVFRDTVGDRLWARGGVAQQNEALCMAFAYNVTRLVYLEEEQGVSVDFDA